jgi:hypothetical protein
MLPRNNCTIEARLFYLRLRDAVWLTVALLLLGNSSIVIINLLLPEPLAALTAPDY